MRWFLLCILLGSSSIILTGCSSVSYEDIVFDGFVWPAPVSSPVYDVWDDSAVLKATWWDNQKHSFLILREDINTQSTLEDVIESNRDALTASYSDLWFDNEWGRTILCDNTPSYAWTFSINDENKSQDALYFVQYLYIYESSVYIISNALADNSPSNRILQSMDSIDCPR